MVISQVHPVAVALRYLYVAERTASEVDRNVQHGSVTDEVASPSAGVAACCRMRGIERI